MGSEEHSTHSTGTNEHHLMSDQTTLLLFVNVRSELSAALRVLQRMKRMHVT
jgi:hypothetical protein